ncbi:MAG: dTMP kinase [bacterium]
MSKKGKLIIIDGSDGAGKKTQSDLLIKKLKENGKDVVFFDFPQYDKFYGKIVARYLNGELGKLDDVNPYLISLPYALDRASAREEICDALNKGKIVICNRYTCSNMAYQSAKFENKKEQDEYVSWDEELEYIQNKMPIPDLVIYLYVPYEISQTLLDKKESGQREYVNGKKRDLHEESKNFLQKVEERYLNLTKEKNWNKIDCCSKKELLSIEIIGEKVWEIVKEVI